jgi:hypothetical protein
MMTNLTKVFIVSADNGLDYSDHSDWTVCACFTKEKAKQIADDLNRMSKAERSLKDRVFNEFEAPYKHTHPQTWLSRSRPVMSQSHRDLNTKVSTGRGNEHDKDILKRRNQSHEAKLNAYTEWFATEYVATQDKWHVDYEAAREVWLKDNNPDAEELKWAHDLDGNFCSGSVEYSWYDLEVIE